MKIRIIKESMQEGAEEIGASIGRSIDQMVAQIQNLPQDAKNKVIKALGGYTQEDYNNIIQQGAEMMDMQGVPREDDPDFGAA